MNQYLRILKVALVLAIQNFAVGRGDSYINLRKENSLNVKSIRFLEKGGEPTSFSSQERFLQNRCNLGAQKNSYIEFRTNLFGCPAEITDQEINTFKSIIRDTYNNLDSCSSPYYRRINNVDLLTDLTSFQGSGDQNFNLEFRLRLSCRGCNDGAILLSYAENNTIDSCPCPAPAKDIFTIALEQILEPLIDDDVVFPHVVCFKEGAEIQQLAQCPSLQYFTTSDVVVEFYGCPLQMDQQKLNNLAATFQETYNRVNLKSAERCDPYFRKIKSITPHLLDDSDYDERRKLSRSKSVANKTRKKSSKVNKSHPKISVRKLYGYDEYSPVTAPYYNEERQNPPEDDDESNSTDDNDESNSSDNDDESKSSEDGDEPYYNDDDASNDRGSPNAPSSNYYEKAPNAPSSRYYENALNAPSSIYYGDSPNAAPNSVSVSEDDGPSDDEPSNDDNALNDDEGPSNDESPFQSPAGSPDESEDEDTCGDYFEVRFSITAGCRGCNLNAVTIFDQSQDQTFYGSSEFAFNIERSRRHLVVNRGENVALSNDARYLQENECTFPLNPYFRAVTEDEIVEAYDAELALKEDTLSLEVESVIEIREAQCDAAVNNFTTSVQLTYASTSNDGIVSPQAQEKLTHNFERSYNSLSQRFCDPDFRSVHKATVTSYTATATRRSRLMQSTDDDSIGNDNSSLSFNFTFIFSFQFFVTGFCRGCPNNFPLFDDASRRMLNMNQVEELSISDSRTYIRLQANNQCFCATNHLGNTAPSTREFFNRYDGDIKASFNRGELEDEYDVLSCVEDDIEDDDEYATEESDIYHECLVDSDCESVFGLEKLCVNRHCLNKGAPRITLTWDGDDDLDLIVFTPQGFRINYEEDFDPVSGGAFDTGFVQDIPGKHVESIFFPLSDRAPSGSYRIAVQSYQQKGEADEWNLQIFENEQSQQPVLMKAGNGQNYNIWYDRSDGTAQRSSIVRRGQCSIEDPFVECCEDLDCPVINDGRKVCANRQCITDRGGPRFTLTYFGNDKYGLTVLTPYQDEIFIDNGFEDVTGGIYEGDKNELATESTWHTQNIYFPPRMPAGNYTFFAYPIEQIGSITDSWELTVWNGDELLRKERGARFVDYFTFYVSDDDE